MKQRPVVRLVKSPPPNKAEGFFLTSSAQRASANRPKDLLGLRDLKAPQITSILDQAVDYKRRLHNENFKATDLAGKTVMNLFFEPSTRTRTSFELAARKLSAQVLNMSPQTSSLSKGESLKDMVENLEAMRPDLLVVRHAASGVPGLIAHYTTAGVVNAGDGSHEHPTQALVDLFTVREILGKIHGIRLLIVGDIAYSRVARSNIYGFSKLGAKVTAVGPATLLPPGLEKLGASHVSTDLNKHLREADVIMLLRIQKERQESLNFPSLAEYSRFYGLTSDRLPLLKREALIMHPGPINRGIEIDPEIADNRDKQGPQTIILKQVENATAVRMAVLSLWGGKSRL